MYFHDYPVLKILIPYVLGIILAFLELFPFIPRIFFIPVLFVIILVFGFLFYKINHYLQKRVGWILMLCFMISGFSSTQSHLTLNKARPGEHFLDKNSYWLVEVLETPVERAASVKCVGRVKSVCPGAFFEEKAILYFGKSPTSASIRVGDIILANARLAVIAPPKNPYAFNYQQHCRKRGIYYSGYISSENFTIAGHSFSRPVKQVAGKLQHYFAQQFARAGLSGDEYSVITAILLGDDETLDPELRASYTSAGVSHILCVSGMHVGIIFMILDFLLKPMDFNKRSRAIKSVILLFSIWFYAHITGLSPSVQRAATMFSFVAIGNILQRNTNVFHSLYASLFFLLLINPMLLFEVGFQLSYLAVFGIVLFQKKCFNLWNPENRIVRYFWELATVSLSAQLGTFPVAIYYFGQFPNYFLLANLFVILLSFIIVVSGIILLATSFSQLLALWAGKILTLEIKLMNGIISFIENLPGAVTERIYISLPQLFLLYLFIFFFYWLLVKKEKLYFWIASSAIALFSVLMAVSRFDTSSEKSITVYAIRRQSAINFNNHGQSVLLNDGIDSKKSATYNFSVASHERTRKIESILLPFEKDTIIPERRFFKNGSFIVFDRYRLYILNRADTLYPCREKIAVDFLYVRGNPLMKPDQVDLVFCFDNVIIDESNTPFYEKRWMDFCEEKNIPYHSCRRDGALLRDFSPDKKRKLMEN